MIFPGKEIIVKDASGASCQTLEITIPFIFGLRAK